ncbi:cAMP-binding protein [Terriglobus roseus DSM 18391]|uniref:cAMP-binding protein n=1 Tax=Terriglobus roseus (strain DSM 18391 / NRRL B-41598 / KBS 63) TaxID=926566 RepID=I3ZHT0_TERRK|nr:Crp/Fnr family transcriptional regulator [Terriglobus roseus]AFL88456.1 cAMP-binding protein [Terriglobus roseus DSM 18391]AFL88798.1 cAMP-binding protein [Terriglobus roseus DSM 18391]
MSKCTGCPHAGKYAFCNLGQAAQAFLDVNSITMEYPRGNVLFREGESAGAVFIVCSGKVKSTATSTEGRSAILRLSGPGDVLGMSAVLGATPYEITAEAVQPCRIRVLHARVLHQFMREFSDASMGAARALAQDYRSAFQEMRLMALPETPAGRLSRLILDWSEESQTTGTPLTMTLTHEELASMTATTRETVTRTLSRLRKDGAIAIKGISLTVLKPATLHDLASC